MNWGGAVRSQAEATKAMQPGQRALCDPAIDAQAAAMLRAAPGKAGNNATLTQVPAERIRIVGAVRVQLLWPSPGTSDLTRHCWHLLHHGQCLLDVGDVGAGDGHRQGHALAVRDD